MADPNDHDPKHRLPEDDSEKQSTEASPLRADDEIEIVSKSEMKREMQRYQTLARQLVELSNEALSTLPLDDAIRQGIREARRLKKPDALNRHLRHLARLLEKHTDLDIMQRKIALFDTTSPVYAQMTQLTERWRDNLINDSAELATFFDDYPEADRQHIGQLVRNTRKAHQDYQQSASDEDTAEPAALQQKKKKLFQALRAVIESQHQN